jgi:hypothetical protein
MPATFVTNVPKEKALEAAEAAYKIDVTGIRNDTPE